MQNNTTTKPLNQNRMTPKEKAKELVEKAKKASSYQYQEYAGAHYTWFEHDIDTLRLIALITVDEILKSFGTLTNGNVFYTTFNAIEYYQEVRQEIINL